MGVLLCASVVYWKLYFKSGRKCVIIFHILWTITYRIKRMLVNWNIVIRIIWLGNY